MLDAASMNQNYTMSTGLPIDQDSTFNFIANEPIDSAFVYNNTLVNPAFDEAIAATRAVHGAWNGTTGMNNNGFAGMENSYSIGSYEAPNYPEDKNLFDTIDFDTCKYIECYIFKW